MKTKRARPKTKTKTTAGARKARQTAGTDKAGHPPPAETWVEVDGERRRLYAIRPETAGKLCLYLDRGEVLELTGWPVALPDTLTPADVLFVGRKKGAPPDKRLLVTRTGGAWVARARRRKYRGDPPEASAPTRAEPTEPPAARVNRATVQALPEREKNRLRAEVFALLVKGQTASGGETLVLSEADEERLEDLIRCGMLPGDPPPSGVDPARLPYLRDMARQRFDAMRNRRDLPQQWFTNEAEANWARAELFRLNSNALGESLAHLGDGNDALRAALLNALTDKTESIRKATPDPKTLSPIQREWLALRVTAKGKTVKYGVTRWPSQRDIAAALGVGKNVVNRMETELEARPDVRTFLAEMRVPLRKPRRNPTPTGTNRKVVRRA